MKNSQGQQAAVSKLAWPIAWLFYRHIFDFIYKSDDRSITVCECLNTKRLLCMKKLLVSSFYSIQISNSIVCGEKKSTY